MASRLGGAADRDGVYLGTQLEKQRKTKLEELRKTKVQERSKEQGRSCTGEGVRGGGPKTEQTEFDLGQEGLFRSRCSHRRSTHTHVLLGL